MIFAVAGSPSHVFEALGRFRIMEFRFGLCGAGLRLEGAHTVVDRVVDHTPNPKCPGRLEIIENRP